MNWKHFGKLFLRPPLGVPFFLLPASAGLLVYSMTSMPEKAPVRIASYVLAFYTLTIWCIRVPSIPLVLFPLCLLCSFSLHAALSGAAHPSVSAW